ncbi:TPA: hypothetical protein VDB83_005151 [Burkholderia cenocepacia]|nr:hypothetical protein [Burkholderia cenocepacia]
MDKKIERRRPDPARMLLERHSLGSAGFCVLILLALTGLPTLDLQLTVAFWCVCLALPIFLSVYLAKEEILYLRNRTEPKLEAALYAAILVAHTGLLLLGTAIACLASHHSPPLGVVVWFALATIYWLNSALEKAVESVKCHQSVNGNTAGSVRNHSKQVIASNSECDGDQSNE